MATGTTDEVVAEVERCFDDAFGVACQMRTDPSVLPGAGAVYLALARSMRRFAETIPGREQLAIELGLTPLKSSPERWQKMREWIQQIPFSPLHPHNPNGFHNRHVLKINHLIVLLMKVYNLFSAVSQSQQVAKATVFRFEMDDMCELNKDAEIRDVRRT